MKKISLLLFSAFLFFSCSEDSKSFINAAGLYNAYNVQSNIYDAKIIEVIDGDTLKIRFAMTNLNNVQQRKLYASLV